MKYNNIFFYWYENHIGKQIDRSSAQRKTVYDYPQEVIRESLINSIVHRDYDIEGSPIYFEINDTAIIIKSPGLPVEPKSENYVCFRTFRLAEKKNRLSL